MNTPILLVNWLADQNREVEIAREEFDQEVLIDSARVDSKRELKIIIDRWLTGNTNAQFLYLGCHGDNHGLFRDSGDADKDRMNYEEFGEFLAGYKGTLRQPIHLWLGACESSSIALAWNDEKDIPVSYLVGFATKVFPPEVAETLHALLRMTRIDPVTYVDEELQKIREAFPTSQVLAFYKEDNSGRYRNVDYLSDFLQKQRETETLE